VVRILCLCLFLHKVRLHPSQIENIFPGASPRCFANNRWIVDCCRSQQDLRGRCHLDPVQIGTTPVLEDEIGHRQRLFFLLVCTGYQHRILLVIGTGIRPDPRYVLNLGFVICLHNDSMAKEHMLEIFLSFHNR